jgi:hypothetical protein
MIEMNVFYMMTAVAVFFAGAGRYSLDGGKGSGVRVSCLTGASLRNVRWQARDLCLSMPKVFRLSQDTRQSEDCHHRRHKSRLRVCPALEDLRQSSARSIFSKG